MRASTIVVAVDPVQGIDVQGDAAVGRKGRKELAHEFRVEGPDFLGRDVHVPDQERAGGQIKRTAHQSVIHWQQAAAVTHNSAFVAKGLGQSLSQCDPCVLDGVVIVDVQITCGPNAHVNEGVARQLIQHVVEKSDACLVVIDPCAIKVDGDRDLRFGSAAGDRRLAHFGSPTDVGALIGAMWRRAKMVRLGLRGACPICQQGGTAKGYPLMSICVFIQIRCTPGSTYKVAESIALREFHSELHSTSGDYDLLMKAYIPEGEDVGKYINEHLLDIVGIERSLTTMTFKAF